MGPLFQLVYILQSVDLEILGICFLEVATSNKIKSAYKELDLWSYYRDRDSISVGYYQPPASCATLTSSTDRSKEDCTDSKLYVSIIHDNYCIVPTKFKQTLSKSFINCLQNHKANLHLDIQSHCCNIKERLSAYLRKLWWQYCINI